MSPFWGGASKLDIEWVEIEQILVTHSLVKLVK